MKNQTASTPIVFGKILTLSVNLCMHWRGFKMRTLNFDDTWGWKFAKTEGWKVADTIFLRVGKLPTIFLMSTNKGRIVSQARLFVAIT